MGDSTIPPPPDTQKIADDYGYLKADMDAHDSLIKKIQEMAKEMGEMQADGTDPAIILMFAMGVVVPDMCKGTEGQMTDLSDKMNVLSDDRNLVSYVQNGFNDFNQFSGGDIETLRSQIQTALNAIHDWANTDNGKYVLDSQTVEQINQAYDALQGDQGMPGTGAACEQLWADAAKTKGEGSAASQHLKNITDQFNTMNSGVSNLGQATQTDVQYVTDFLQQLYGWLGNMLHSWANGEKVPVQNEKGS